MRRNGFLAITITALLAVASPAAAETFTVTTTNDVTGQCDGTNCESIRQALAAAEGAKRAGHHPRSRGRLPADAGRVDGRQCGDYRGRRRP